MTRKDYIKIAAVLAVQRPAATCSWEVIARWDNIVRAFSRMLWEDNHRFQSSKFKEACNK